MLMEISGSDECEKVTKNVKQNKAVNPTPKPMFITKTELNTYITVKMCGGFILGVNQFLWLRY